MKQTKQAQEVLDRISTPLNLPNWGIFQSPTEFLVAIKKLSPAQQEQMLLDIAWKCWGKRVSNTRITMIQAYRISQIEEVK